ncbi:hypothetical protein J8273_2385 [Carpediemonas membranifera]|uniref:Uncharacterized protein n=1 Tax=Carpediemonas membranifera TaxID=201153 RepID=A0A8J6BZZ2_9EUKA|nr:hypothetical protein J8273_2385 [Carpediemonas membranifera]|eukprot:KAG9396036.1 hypothetical protein J8273_2385 [Carpediemonas membranifera]
MICDGTYLYVCTQLEILRYSLDLELLDSVTLGTSGVSFNQVRLYNKGGLSVALLSSDYTEVSILGINSDFSAVATSLWTGRFYVPAIPSLAPVFAAQPGAISAHQQTSYTGYKSGFIDYDSGSDDWSFSASNTFTHSTVSSTTLGFNSVDQRNGVVMANELFYEDARTYQFETLDSSLDAIDGTEESYGINYVGYTCFVDNMCLWPMFKVYEDVYFVESMDPMTYEVTLTLRFEQMSAPTSAGGWMPVALAAVVLALAVLA